MSAIKVDPTTGDMQITNNAMVLETDVSEETRQRLTSKLQTFLGEWFLNENIGIPYYQDILKKHPDLRRIKALFHEVIIADEQVASLESPLVLDYDAGSRSLSLAFEALLNDGVYLSYTEHILQENR